MTLAPAGYPLSSRSSSTLISETRVGVAWWIVAVLAGVKVRGGIVDPPAHYAGVGALAQRSSRAGITPETT